MTESCYLDYNATTPLAPEVLEAMLPYFSERFGNPSSLHRMGQASAKALRSARKEVADFLGAADPKEIVFTSGGTESNHLAVYSALEARPAKREIVVSNAEHSSILKLCDHLQDKGYKIHRVPIEPGGGLDPDKVIALTGEQTALVSLMMANNETGVIFPVEAIGRRLKEKEILFHVDAVQAVGKCILDLKTFPADYVSAAAHKFYGPKGVGALYVREGALCRSLHHGGSQERGRRAGTENVASIVGLGAASRWLKEHLEQQRLHLRTLRDTFEQGLRERISGIRIHGRDNERLPNTSCVGFEGVDGESLLFALDEKGFCVSNGSACMSGAGEPSHVLKAMGLSDEEAQSSIRFSFGRYTQASDIEDLLETLTVLVDQLRSGGTRRRTA